MTEDDVKKIVESMLGDYLSTNKVDDGKVDKDQNEFLLNNKVDGRNILDHTFTTTAAETFDHNFGRIPKGAIVIAKSKAATIILDKSLFTDKRITATSSVANNAVRFLIL
jgi:hypothetical protein